MATWRDGPEYAPVQRPDAFAAPAVEPLPSAPQARRADAILIPPVGYDLPDTAQDLAQVLPPSRQRRDPNEPFTVVSSVLTDSSAWGSAHSHSGGAAPAWDPRLPLPSHVAAVPAASSAAYPPPVPGTSPYPPSYQGQSTSPYPPPSSQTQGTSAYPPPSYPGQGTSAYPPPSSQTQGTSPYPPPSFPAPGTPPWLGSGENTTPPQAPPVAPTALGAVRAAGYGLLITLFVGGLVSVLSMVCLVTGWYLVLLVAYRRKAVRYLFGAASACAVVFGLASYATGGLSAALEVMNLVAQLLCWLCALLTVFVQYSAMVAGDTPERRP